MKYLLGLGSSHPRAQYYLKRCIFQLEKSPHIHLHACSSFYQNPPFGGATYFSFMNAAAAISCPLPVDGLWQAVAHIEHTLGRARFVKNNSRTIDIDILWSSIGTTKTQFVRLPHPGLFERPLALLPSIEAAQNAHWLLPSVFFEQARKLYHEANFKKLAQSKRYDGHF